MALVPTVAHLPKHYCNQTPPPPDHVLDKGALEGTNIFPMAAVAEWSKALLGKEKINENQTNSALPPAWAIFAKLCVPQLWHPSILLLFLLRQQTVGIFHI